MENNLSILSRFTYQVIIRLNFGAKISLTELGPYIYMAAIALYSTINIRRCYRNYSIALKSLKLMLIQFNSHNFLPTPPI